MIGGRLFGLVWHHLWLLSLCDTMSLKEESHHCRVTHLKRTQGQARLRCRQRRPRTKTNTWPPQAVLVLLFYC